MRLSVLVCLCRSVTLLVFVSVILVVSAVLSVPTSARVTTLTVCASGCMFSDFQLALETAQAGDTIVLRAGETFVGNFVLPFKAGTGAPILIRSDAPNSVLPAADVRLIPQGQPGANTALNALARLRGRGGTWKSTPVLQAEPGAHGYVLQFLDIDGFAQEGWETLVQLGTNAPEQNTLASVPYSIVLDRVFVHGHPAKYQKRCISLDGRDLAVLNSYVVDCGSWTVDAQAIAGFNGPGPFRIINNYLEATGENIMFGGADPKIDDLVPSGLEIRRNHLVKPLAWRKPILPAPTAAPSATVTRGAGSLAAGTHYFKVVGVLQSAAEIAVSAPSPERAVSVSSSGSAVTLAWSAVPGVDRYRIYRGTAAGGQNRYVETSSSATSFVYRGTGEIAAAPRTTGTVWNVKNLLELKNARNVVVAGNVFEQIWVASQKGYAILFTPRNQNGTAPWVVVSDVLVANNVIRHAAGGFGIAGMDDMNVSQRTSRITIRNNLAYDIAKTWGGPSHFLLITGSPADLTIDHNTIMQEGNIILIDGGPSSGFEFTNNIAPHGSYGIFGSGAGMGVAALSGYFPNAVVRRNAIGGAPAWLYPPDNLYPDLATFSAQFVDAAAYDYRLVAGSIFRSTGTDGKNLGVDFTLLNAAVQGVVAGDAGGSGGDDGDGGGGGGTGDGGGGSLPHGGTARAVPGLIQLEDFDDGGSGAAYGDTTPGNAGGQYRSSDVDIAAATDSGGGYCVGWIKPGEWLKYTVNVAAAGSYRLEFRVASSGGGGTFHLAVNGVDKTGPITIPNTGGHQAWTTIVKADVPLSAGAQVWTLVMDRLGSGGGFGNINHIRAVAAAAGSSTAYTGTPFTLPGTVQAEDFDNGGEGVAYHDRTAGNAGGAYRTTNVDIATASDTGGGYTLGWVGATEWLNYTVDVSAAGTYDIEVRVASSGAGGTFHIDVNGVNKTGTLTVPNTGGWQTWTTVRKSGVSLAAGVQVWRLVMDTEGVSSVGNFNYIKVAPTPGGSPFGGTPAALPGTLQAEDFDSGGEGVAYHDLTAGNAGGTYRTTNVDIAAAADTGGGYTLGWVGAREWLNYTVDVGAAGTYDIEVRVASAGSGGTFHIEVNGVNKTGTLTVPNTGGWQSWATIRKTGVTLGAGTQVWRIVMDSNGPTAAVGNFNYVRAIAR